MAELQPQPIPSEMLGSEKIARIPDTSTTSMRISPINGSTFTENGYVYFDIPSLNGYLNPNSFYLNMKQSYTISNNNDCTLLGIPAFTPLVQYYVELNSQVKDVIMNYNMVCYTQAMLKMSASQRAGLGYSLGIGAGRLTGRILPQNGVTTFSTSCPLPTILSNAEKFIPLFLFPTIRVAFQFDSISNMINTGAAGVVNAHSFTNLELCFDVVNVPMPILNAVRNIYSQKPYIIKTSSYNVSNIPNISAGTSGSVNLTSNTRLSSIKSVFVNSTGTNANFFNKNYDSVDPTNGSSTAFQVEISGQNYPPKQLNTLDLKAGCMSELCLALYGNRNILNSDLGIAYAQGTGFDATEATVAGAATTSALPASFFFGVNTEAISSNQVMLTGADSRNSAINVKLNINAALTNQIQPRITALYDVLIKIDPTTRDVELLT